MLRLEKIASDIGEQNQFVYAVPISQKKKGQTPIYRHPKAAHKIYDVPFYIKNLRDFWNIALYKFPNNKLIEDLTYSQVDKLTTNIGSWLAKNNHQKFYLYCKNSPEWTLTDIASWKHGLTNIPLYDTLGAQAFHHILQLTQGTAICTTAQLIPNLKSHLAQSRFNINTVIFFDSIKPQDKQSLKKLNLKVYNIEQLKQSKQFVDFPDVNIDFALTLAFTSGTTGLPKGVVQTHRMAISQCMSMIGHYQYRETDVHMSYLPIAHTFERFVIWCCVNTGANIRYSKFPPTQILKDLAIIKPTTIPIVPRLLNKLYPPMKQLFDKQQKPDKIIAMFGGRLKKLVTGSAPVAANILTFFQQVLNCDIRQGYGQTETTAASFVTYEGDKNFGIVGGPNLCTQFKLVDVPQMNYTSESNPPKGQICSRGPSIFRQYYKNKEATNQTVDEDGWNHSGDIGMIMPNGALKIIDRKKNIFKLSQGQYIAPEKVQNIYARCRFVAECFLYGDSLRDYNVAIVHPTLDLLPTVAKNLGITQTDPQKLCNDKKIVEFVYDQMTKQARADGLLGFEIAKKIRLWPKSFTLYGIFTSTMKLQRYVAKKVFQQQIDKLYAQ